jgi:hypothetical protein
VWLRIDNGDVNLSRSNLTGQAQSRVEADVPGAHDQDPLRPERAKLGPDRPLR